MSLSMYSRSTFKYLIILVVCMGLVAGQLQLYGAGSIAPTGVTRYDPSRAYNTYILFSAPDQHTYLIDMNGNEVHSWNYFGFPPTLLEARLAGGEPGHVIVQYESIDAKGTSPTPGRPTFF